MRHVPVPQSSVCLCRPRPSGAGLASPNFSLIRNSALAFGGSALIQLLLEHQLCPVPAGVRHRGR